MFHKTELIALARRNCHFIANNLRRFEKRKPTNPGKYRKDEDQSTLSQKFTGFKNLLMFVVVFLHNSLVNTYLNKTYDNFSPANKLEISKM